MSYIILFNLFIIHIELIKIKKHAPGVVNTSLGCAFYKLSTFR